MAPPVLLFGPLAGLLLLSRPRRVREWLWLLATATWSALWLDQAGGLAGQFARAEAVLITGSYLALTLWRPSARFSRALLATAIGGVALVVWMWYFGVGWTAVREAVEQDLWRYNRDFIMRLGQVAPGMSDAGMLDEMSAMVRSIALLYPALLALASMAGVTLAWVWHRRIAQRPLGPAPAGFSSFEFSDQLVWGWVIGLALCLAPLPEVWGSVRRQPASGLGGVVCGPRPGGVRRRNPQSSGPGHCHTVTHCHAAVAVCGGRADPAGSGRHLARFPTPPCCVGYLRELSYDRSNTP